MTIRGLCRQLGGTTNVELKSLGTVASKVPTIARSRPTKADAQPINLPPLTGKRKDEIARLARRTVTLYLPDDSGSMYGTFGDPTGIRYAAARSLDRLQRQSGGGLAGVVHWGTDAPMDMVTRPVDVKKCRRVIEKALVIPPSLGGNDLPAALRRAAEILPNNGDYLPLIFVISDGIEDVTDETHEAVAGLPPSSVHLLLLDRSNWCSGEMEEAWRSVAFGSFTRLEHLDNTRTMAIELAQIYAKALGVSLADYPSKNRFRRST